MKPMFDNLSGMTLGKKISYLRKQRGWTQQELADKISVHGRHVTRLEHDKMKPSPATLAQLSQVFQVEPDVLADAITKSADNPQLQSAVQMVYQLDPDDQSMVVRFVQALFAKKRMEQALSFR